MRQLGDLFARRLRDEGGPELMAAAIVATTNEVLQDQWSPQDAQAVSWQRDTVTIRVGHSAIAGLIRQQEEGIVLAINQRLNRRFPSSQPVLHVVTRTGTNS